MLVYYVLNFYLQSEKSMLFNNWQKIVQRRVKHKGVPMAQSIAKSAVFSSHSESAASVSAYDRTAYLSNHVDDNGYIEK